MMYRLTNDVFITLNSKLEHRSRKS